MAPQKTEAQRKRSFVKLSKSTLAWCLIPIWLQEESRLGWAEGLNPVTFP